MNLDFVMKLFIAIIVVLFLIIGAYYTANDLSELFGYGKFHITKPGPNAASLKNVGVKNITAFKINESATYKDCLEDCKNKRYIPAHYSNCEDECAWMCNQTSNKKCIRVSVTLRIGTINGEFSAKFVQGEVTIFEEDFTNLPQMSIVTRPYVFYLQEPKRLSSVEDTNFTWSVDRGEKEGAIKLGGIPAMLYVHLGDSCEYTNVKCSHLVDEFSTIKKGSMSESGKIDIGNFENCKRVFINITDKECNDPATIRDFTDNIEVKELTIKDNGTYELVCPQNDQKMELQYEVPCSMNYEVEYSKGLYWDDSVFCNSTTNTCQVGS